MRRVIRRTRSFSTSSRRRHSSDYNRDRYDDNTTDCLPDRDSARDRDRPSGTPKKKSPWGIIIIVIIIGVVIWAVFRGSSGTTNETKQAGPEAVVRAVIASLGQNNKTTAKQYVATGDSTTSSQVDTLFNNYSGYFIYDDDYVDITLTSTNLTNVSDTEARVDISGTAEVVEVTYEIDEDEWGEEIEHKIEAVVDEFTFANIRFGLTKTGEEWFLLEVPATIF